MKVLIGSNGGLTGVYLAKQLRQIPGLYLYGADATETTVGKFFVDKQCLLPRATAPDFLQKLLTLFRQEGIDVYLPTHSQEMIVVAQNADAIRAQSSVRFLVSPYVTYEALDNKRDANAHLRAIGIPVPALIEDEPCSYPILMKSDLGSGGNGLVRIDHPEVYHAYRATTPSVSFYQIVRGNEYTLDCMFDAEGKLLGMNQRKRVKTIGGAVSITTNAPEFDITPWIERIAAAWCFCGCVNFQYIVQDEIPYFIDVNLRYPSGGLPLTVQSGLNIPRMTIDLLSGKEIVPHAQAQRYSHMTMFRYFEEVFEE